MITFDNHHNYKHWKSIPNDKSGLTELDLLGSLQYEVLN